MDVYEFARLAWCRADMELALEGLCYSVALRTLLKHDSLALRSVRGSTVRVAHVRACCNNLLLHVVLRVYLRQ